MHRFIFGLRKGSGFYTGRHIPAPPLKKSRMPIRWPACCASLSLCLLVGGVGLAASAVHAQTGAASAWRETATAEEQALDAAAFQPVEAALATQYPDVQSAVVVLRGRVVYRFYRDGEPEKLLLASVPLDRNLNAEQIGGASRREGG